MEKKSVFARLFGLDGEPKDALSVSVKERFNPTSTLYATTILMLSELAKTQEEMFARSEKMRLAKRAKALGFTNSYTVAEQAHFNENVKLLQFMIEMWRDLGRDAILVGYNHFREILHRHDLMCVSFDAYKGDIPAKNLQEIENAVSRLKTLGEEKNSRYNKRLSSRVHIARSSKVLLDIIRFPYYFQGDSDYSLQGSGELVIFDIAPSPKGTMFIAAPKDFVQKPSVKRAGGESKLPRSYIYKELYSHLSDNIRAANKILSEVREYANIEYSPIPKPLPRNYDPFVCTLCDYGVIIHSKWGAEAEDATIKRYEQLRDAIMGGAK